MNGLLGFKILTSRLRLPLMLSAGMGAALIACKLGSHGTKGENSNELRLALGSEPPVLDPQMADTGVSVFVLRQVVSTLFQYDSQQRIVPYDAESFEWTRGGRLLSVKIRGDLTWSDSQPVKACQYRDGILRALDPGVMSPLSEILFEIRGARDRKLKNGREANVGLRCNDEARSLEFDSDTPYSPKILPALAFVVSSPVRTDLLKTRQNSWLLPQSKGELGVGSGAFVLSEWSHDRRIRLRARRLEEATLPEDRRAKVDAVDMPIVRDPKTAFAMFERGDIDVVDELPPILMPRLMKRKDLILAPSPTTYMVGFSLRANPVLRDKRVRVALAAAAHQEEVPSLLKGGERVANGWIPPDLLTGHPQLQDSSFDTDKANHFLDAAGFKDRSKFPVLKLFYNPGDRHQLLMERLVHNWKTYLGIQVELNPLEWKMLVAQLKSAPPDLYRYAWTAVYPDPLFFLELFTSTSLNNFGGWKNSQYDKMVEALSKVPIEKRDEAFWHKVLHVQMILVREDPALIPIYHYVRAALVSPRAHGLTFSSLGMVLLKEVSLKP